MKFDKRPYVLANKSDKTGISETKRLAEAIGISAHQKTGNIQALPDMQGAGQVRTLREAASVNSTLAALLTQFAGATTRSAQMALMDGILKEWSNTSTMATTFTGAYAGPCADGKNADHRHPPWSRIGKYQ